MRNVDATHIYLAVGTAAGPCAAHGSDARRGRGLHSKYSKPRRSVLLATSHPAVSHQQLVPPAPPCRRRRQAQRRCPAPHVEQWRQTQARESSYETCYEPHAAVWPTANRAIGLLESGAAVEWQWRCVAVSLAMGRSHGATVERKLDALHSEALWCRQAGAAPAGRGVSKRDEMRWTTAESGT